MFIRIKEKCQTASSGDAAVTHCPGLKDSDQTPLGGDLGSSAPPNSTF